MDEIEEYRDYKIRFLDREDVKDGRSFILADPIFPYFPHLFVMKGEHNTTEMRLLQMKQMIDCVVDSGYRNKPIDFWNDLMESKHIIWNGESQSS